MSPSTLSIIIIPLVFEQSATPKRNLGTLTSPVFPFHPPGQVCAHRCMTPCVSLFPLHAFAICCEHTNQMDRVKKQGNSAQFIASAAGVPSGIERAESLPVSSFVSSLSRRIFCLLPECSPFLGLSKGRGVPRCTFTTMETCHWTKER